MWGWFGTSTLSADFREGHLANVLAGLAVKAYDDIVDLELAPGSSPRRADEDWYAVGLGYEPLGRWRVGA